MRSASPFHRQRAKLTQKRGRAILEDAETALKSAGVLAITIRLRNGDLLEEPAAVENDAGMIVLGKRGEAADFARMHLGSNMERIARSSTKPVFVTARAFRPISKVLIAYDGGPSAMKAVDHVARSPLFAGLDIRLLIVDAETDEARRRLESARATLEAGGREISAEIKAGRPDKIIADAVEKDGVDLLVMGAYGHSRIRNLIIGSTTAGMIRSCKIPLLLFR